MKGKPSKDNQAFADDFLVRLHTMFNYLQPGEIKEQIRDGVLFFKQKHTRICLYNVYPDSVQIIFNRNLLSNHFEASHDYLVSAPVDWELMLLMLTDILNKNTGQEKEQWPLRFKSNLSRPNRNPGRILKDPGLLQTNCI